MKYFLVSTIFAIGMTASAVKPLFDIRASRPEHYQSMGSGKTSWKIQGDKLLLTILPDSADAYPGIIVKPQRGKYFDFSGGSVLAVDVRNLSNRPARLQIEAVTLSKRPGRLFEYQVPGGIALNPAETATLRLPYVRAGRNNAGWAPAGMQGVFDGFDSRLHHLDPRKVEEIRFFIHNNQFPRRFELSNFRLEAPPAPLPAALADAQIFYPCIDRFGQYRHAEWPGKVKNETDLKKAAETEKSDLETHSEAPGDRTIYGGWANGPALQATGHFYTAKYRGKWYLVDPSGKLFWSLGLNCINLKYDTGLDLREHYFEWLPDRNDQRFGSLYGISSPAAHFYKERGLRPKTFDFYRANLIRKYGDQYVETWTNRTARRLKSWGFNTIGSWSDTRIIQNSRIPYITQVYAHGAPCIEGDNGFWYKFYDVFSPDFLRTLQNNLRRNAEMFKDPYCIGLFIDNEISWGGETGLSRSVLRSPARQPAKLAFVRLLKDKYQTVSRLNSIWRTNYKDWNDLLRRTSLPDERFAGKDMQEFNEILVDRYFKICRDAIREIAPGKLYLGCRFAFNGHPVAIRHAAKYADILSFNHYLYSVSDVALPDNIDKPIIIGEFHFGVPGYGPPHPGLCATADQTERARALERYVESALYNPLIVGAHYFRFADEMATGRAFDCENMQTGLVDIADTPYWEMIDQLRKLSKRLYEIRTGTPSGKSPCGRGVHSAQGL